MKALLNRPKPISNGYVAYRRTSEEEEKEQGKNVEQNAVLFNPLQTSSLWYVPTIVHLPLCVIYR